MNLPQRVRHASLVAQERCEVDGLFGIIFGPTAHPSTMPLTPLVGQEAQVPMARGMEFTMRLGWHTSTDYSIDNQHFLSPPFNFL